MHKVDQGNAVTAVVEYDAAGNGHNTSRKRHYRHKGCRKRFTATTRTCVRATKRPFRDWICAIYNVLTGRKGIYVMQLSKELGVKCRTAWHMPHRIREGCGREDFTLRDTVEVDETCIGRKEAKKHEAKRRRTGRGAVGKTAVVGVRQRGGKVKAEPVDRTDTHTLIGFVGGAVEPDSTALIADNGESAAPVAV